MSSFDWKAVTDIVEKDFPSYIPIVSNGDVENYNLLNFLSLSEPENNSIPRFYYYGDEKDVWEDLKKTLKPKFASKKLCRYVDSMTSKRSPDQASSTFRSFSLGTVSEHKVNYIDLDKWLSATLPYSRTDDVVNLAEGGQLFIIHNVIMAEKLIITEENEECIEGKARPAVCCRNRPEEFGSFPIGFKVCKVGSKSRTNYSKHLATEYYLKAEDLKFFNMPYKERWTIHDIHKTWCILV